jgi:hypothetical protein
MDEARFDAASGRRGIEDYRERAGGMTTRKRAQAAVEQVDVRMSKRVVIDLIRAHPEAWFEYVPDPRLKSAEEAIAALEAHPEDTIVNGMLSGRSEMPPTFAGNVVESFDASIQSLDMINEALGELRKRVRGIREQRALVLMQTDLSVAIERMRSANERAKELSALLQERFDDTNRTR